MDDKLIEIVNKLYKRTQEQSIEWYLTDNDSVYQVEVANSIIKIYKEPLSIEPIYSINIYNMNGTLLQNINSKELDPVNDDLTAVEAMKEIYQTARRQALGVDKAIDDILNSL